MSVKSWLGLGVLVVLVISFVNVVMLMPPVDTDSLFQTTDASFYTRIDPSGLVWLLIVNLLICASILSGTLLASLRIFNGDIGDLRISPKRFFEHFAFAILAVSAMGVFVEILFMMEKTEMSSSGGRFYIFYYQVYVLHPDLIGWILASATTFVTVFVWMKVVGLRDQPCMFMAAVLTLSIFTIWLLTMQFGENVVNLVVFLSILCGPILIAGTVKSLASSPSIGSDYQASTSS